MKKIFLILFAAALFSLTTVYGQETDFSKFGIETLNQHVPQGLKAGDKAPYFSGYDQTGKSVQSKNILEKGPMVLFFYRGNWCPACNKYLTAYQDSLNIITGLGANLVAVTPESIENVEQTVKMHNIGFTVIYDCQEQIMKDYDVMFSVTKEFQELVKSKISIDIAKNNGRDAAHLPVAATYIINKDGIIVAVWFDPDYHNRASVKWMIKNLALAF